MMLQLGDDGVVSSVNEEELIYVDKNELKQFIDNYHELEKENEQLKEQLILANGFIKMIENCYEDMTIEDILYEKYGEFQDELHLQMAIAKEEIE